MSNTMERVFPKIFCIENLQCQQGVSFDYRATLYHDQACMTVSFNSAKRELKLTPGKLVSIRWLPQMCSNQGAIRVAGLTLHKVAAAMFNQENHNPFMLVPHRPDMDRHLIDCARDLWNISSKPMRQQLYELVMPKTVQFWP